MLNERITENIVRNQLREKGYYYYYDDDDDDDIVIEEQSSRNPRINKLLYASHLKDFFNVTAIALSGETEKEKKYRLSYG